MLPSATVSLPAVAQEDDELENDPFKQYFRVKSGGTPFTVTIPQEQEEWDGSETSWDEKNHDQYIHDTELVRGGGCCC
jgi:hypothetical protein